MAFEKAYGAMERDDWNIATAMLDKLNKPDIFSCFYDKIACWRKCANQKSHERYDILIFTAGWELVLWRALLLLSLTLFDVDLTC
jgi:hypothetical protein